MSPFQRAQELRQKKAERVRAAQAILDKADAENRVLTADENAAFDKTHGEIEGLSSEIARCERQRTAELALEADLKPAGGAPGGQAVDTRTLAACSTLAFRAFLAGTTERRDALPVEARKLYDARGFAPNLNAYGMLPAGADGRAEGRGRGFELFTQDELRELRLVNGEWERRAPQSTAAGAGGDFIPTGFVPRVEAALKAFGGMMESGAEVLRTDSGNDLPFPTDDDTGNIGAILAESTDHNEQAVTTDAVVIEAFKYESKVVLIPTELLEDSAINVEAWSGDKAGTRIARILNQHFTKGTGSSQPRGVIVASAKGVDLASKTTIEPDELVDLKHSVDPAYRTQSAMFMFNDATLLVLKKKKNANGDRLWTPGIADGQPDRIDGTPYLINQDVASIGSSAKCVAYGAFRYYKIRLVRAMRLIVFRELYAKKDQIGILALMRADGDLVNTAAVKHALCPA